MTVFACACVTPAATDSAPIATNALAPAMAAATRNVCFFTSDQPPIDLIGLDLQCATRMSLYVILPVDSQLHRRRTQHRSRTALAQVIHSLLNEHVDRPIARAERQIAFWLDAADERGPASAASYTSAAN